MKKQQGRWSAPISRTNNSTTIVSNETESNFTASSLPFNETVAKVLNETLMANSSTSTRLDDEEEQLILDDNGSETASRRPETTINTDESATHTFYMCYYLILAFYCISWWISDDGEAKGNGSNWFDQSTDIGIDLLIVIDDSVYDTFYSINNNDTYSTHYAVQTHFDAIFSQVRSAAILINLIRH